MGEGRRESGKKVAKLEGVDGRKGDWRGTGDVFRLTVASGFRGTLEREGMNQSLRDGLSSRSED